MDNIRLVIITGLSGAGKSHAVRSLEDLGYFCVDNLPSALIPKFGEICVQSGGKINRVALVMDIRGGDFVQKLFQGLEYLEKQGISHEILFLDASDEVLVRRYKETRRRHPLAPYGRVPEGIVLERQRLMELRERADILLDTSTLTPAQLKKEITAIYTEGERSEDLAISVLSFGFKHGIPLDADLVFDVRFLPNPFYDEHLRPFTGNDECICDYLHRIPATQKFLNKLTSMLEFLVPLYQREGKSQLVVAIGCTGGRHRSVYVANRLADHMRAGHFRTTLEHRDVGLERGQEVP